MHRYRQPPVPAGYSPPLPAETSVPACSKPRQRPNKDNKKRICSSISNCKTFPVHFGSLPCAGFRRPPNVRSQRQSHRDRRGQLPTAAHPQGQHEHDKSRADSGVIDRQQFGGHCRRVGSERPRSKINRIICSGKDTIKSMTGAPISFMPETGSATGRSVPAGTS